MPIEIVCPCGKEYSLANSLAGKQMTCHDCNTVFEVPDDVEEEKPSRRNRRQMTDSELEEDERYARKKGQETKKDATSSRLIGIGLIALAIIWFVCGIIFLDTIYFYPIILVIIGIYALVKGQFE